MPRKVYGVPRARTVMLEGEVFVKLYHPQKPVFLRFWEAAAVPKARCFVKNWHPSKKYGRAIFRSRDHAAKAIREQWRRIRSYHKIRSSSTKENRR